ncbi:hypothetical protein ABT026_17615 [Streptomyces sp. NPDC002734]
MGEVRAVRAGAAGAGLGAVTGLLGVGGTAPHPHPHPTRTVQGS